MSWRRRRKVKEKKPWVKIREILDTAYDKDVFLSGVCSYLQLNIALGKISYLFKGYGTAAWNQWEEAKTILKNVIISINKAIRNLPDPEREPVEASIESVLKLISWVDKEKTFIISPGAVDRLARLSFEHTLRSLTAEIRALIQHLRKLSIDTLKKLGVAPYII